MSIYRMSDVWKYSQHKGTALLLMLALADSADDLGICWPGYEHLAHKIRMSRISVIRLVDACHTSGELWRLSRPHQRSNVYIVTIGLTREDLRASSEKAITMGVRAPTGSINLIPPPQVLEVVSKCYHLGQGSNNLIPGSITAMIPGSITAMIPDPSLSLITQEEDGSSFWSSILETLRGQMTKATFEAHLLGSTATQNNGTVTVAVRCAHSIEWLDGRLRPLITRAVEREVGHEVQLTFTAQELQP